ncbi:hypothetical protein GDO78_021618 [Eleutherodactylus coqui]|uniref:Olfactory receptor n=1 Tax=Eleutherodactylus coqui TaxID=57060 RepID=A0A8J6JSD6_ELECQ|nr:hypothetical protein GDO78_021618 [Eleutherodactylus coqui]
MEATNKTLVLEFMLKGFSGGAKLSIIVFVIIMFLFFIIVFGNTFLIIIICINHQLHLPMYYFLAALSLMEILTNFLVIPKVLTIIIAGQTGISKEVCFTQCFFYFFCTSSCFLFLGVMSFDRYVAICHPLRYCTIMRKKFCILLVFGCWASAICSILYPIVVLSRMQYCSPILDHLFCDSAALVRVSCTDATLIKVYGIFSAIFILIGPLTITIISYILIVFTVIRIPSDTGRQKTFSTCLAHLTMVAIVFGSAIFLEMRPPSYQSVEVNKVLILGTTMLAPLANPFVYTLRNKSVKDAIAVTLKRKKIFF